MKVLPMAEARRRLPELVRKVAEGRQPVGIGRRGKLEALLVAPHAAEMRPLSGLVEIVGGWDELDATEAELRTAIQSELEREWDELYGAAPKGSGSASPARKRSRRG